MAKKKKKKNVRAKKKAGKGAAKKQTRSSSKRKKTSKKSRKKPHKKSHKKSAKKSTKKTSQKAPSKKASAKKPDKKEPGRFIQSFKIKLAKDLRKPIIVFFAFLGFFVIYQLASVVITFELLGKAIPGTRVAGIDVGALTLDEIQNKLIEKGQPYLDSPIPIIFGDHTEEFTPSELGISLMPRNTLQDVQFVQFYNTNLVDIFSTFWGGREIPFYVSVDIGSTVKSIEERFEFEDRKSKNAYLAFEEGVLTIVSEKEGEAIDVRELYQDIKNSANNLSAEPMEVQAVPHSPLVTAADLEEEMETIKETLNKKITLRYENWKWPVYLIDHVDWLEFEYKDTLNIGEVVKLPLNLEKQYTASIPDPISIDRSLWISVSKPTFLAYVDSDISPMIEVEPQDVKIYTDENDKIVIEGKGENGKMIKDEYLVAALTLASNYDINEVPIPVKEKQVNVEVSDDLQMLGIETLIGTGRSAFAGSTANRIHNIGVGVNRFNGLLVLPGETFSFNANLGRVDGATGYLPELVIKAEGTLPEYGGGLCQVSSTLYRAVLFSGLPVIERHPHSYAVSYYSQVYGYGLDATIYPGVRDVKFLNDTSGHILIQAYTEGLRAYFKFYGTDDGRTVELEGPYICCYRSPGPAITIESPSLPPGGRKQMEIPHTGFNATWYRHLTKDGETIKEPLYTTYQAIPAKVLVGPSVDTGESAEGEDAAEDENAAEESVPE